MLGAQAMPWALSLLSVNDDQSFDEPRTDREGLEF